MLLRTFTFSLSLLTASANAVELHALIDLRASHSNAERGFLEAGLGKSRYDASSPRLDVGQAVMRLEFDIHESISTVLDLSADRQHKNTLDIREAWLDWSPVPSGAWKTRVKAGFFFPPTSVEIDYQGIGWVPMRTISSSAINSWIGEELRTKGVEWSSRRLGRYADSSFDAGMVAAIFGGNDPAGTLLAWRGWSISDRIAGHSEALQLADLPVYRPDGEIPRQARTIHPFREIDGRPGYYAGVNVNQGDRFEFAALHYDNRANPLSVHKGQYGWRTRFNHVSAVWRPNSDWDLLFQAMRGDTLMGANGVALDFRSWYALASRRLGRGSLALRYDRFSTSEHDILPQDPNDERGHALALAYSLPLSRGLTLMIESLTVDSDRTGRQLLNANRQQTERSLIAALRWKL